MNDTSQSATTDSKDSSKEQQSQCELVPPGDILGSFVAELNANLRRLAD